MGTPDHFTYLLVVLHSWGVMPEERFDALALDHLQHYRAAGELGAIKDRMLAGVHAYRLTVRGRAYLARPRRHGEVDRQPVIALHDVTAVLDRLAAVHGQSFPKLRTLLR